MTVAGGGPARDDAVRRMTSSAVESALHLTKPIPTSSKSMAV